MRITYDPEADALYIAFGEGPATVEEVGEGIALDWDAEGTHIPHPLHSSR
ncbi:DUF2283 domain-containing protein [Thermus scotoductus]|nr:DUF2283 domain-containing protein [Thermus scotoductus]